MIDTFLQFLEASENSVDNIFVPIFTIIITWFLSRLKSPDHGKKDWKCKRKRGSFEYYTIHIAVTFLAPIFVSAINGGIREYKIQPLFIGNEKMISICYDLLIVVSHSIVYGLVTWIITSLDILFVPNKIEKKWQIKRGILLYSPILYNYILGIILNYKESIIDLPWYHSWLLFAFQMSALFFFDDGKLYKFEKMIIKTKDGEVIEANVKDVCKKGKWLRIKKNFGFRELLLLFDDVKSIEYYK